MKLRDYQIDLIEKARESFSGGADAICLQLPTGAGKTAIESEIISNLTKNKKITWHIYPRNEIGNQVSEHFKKWNIPHGNIKVGSSESLAFGTHLISKDTLKRRIDKIKNKPDYIIFDEGHLNILFQIELREKFPDAKIITLTATPERLDGKGLSKKGGGICDELIEGISIPELTSRGFLAHLRYFAPYVEELQNIKRIGIECEPNSLDELLSKKRIYGQAIDHYRNIADKKPALVFTRDVKSAYKMAEEFNKYGYKFYCLEAKSKVSERQILIDALNHGKIDGIVSCEIFIYGIDIRRVEVGICMRPTESRSLAMQMIGRELRTFEERYCHKCNKKYEGFLHSCGAEGELIYKKEYAYFLDMVNNLYTHQEPHAPGVPLHYLDKIDWNFHGTEKRKRVKTDERLTTLRLCSNCYMYFEGNICPNCGTACGTKQREELKKVEAELTEIEPIALSDRPPEEKKEYIDRIESAVSRYSSIQDCQAVTDMIRIADELGNQPMWIYHKLNGEGRKSVNVSLLEEISRQKNFKKGWSWVQREKLKERM